MRWIVKQVDRLPRYEVEADSFQLDERGNIVFCNSSGARLGAITDIEYVKPMTDVEVSMYDEES